VGNGDPALNHANLYSDLLHSVGIYLEDINTRAYADNPDLLDSAFTVPLLELVLSQFSQIYFPELLGMTLNLEWEVVGLKPIIKLFESFGLNAQFYKMHVGIDNAVNGHGGKAKRAVEIYLDHIRAESGEVEMQAQWRRIWRGYTAFKYLGSLFSDLTNKLAKPPTPTQQVYAMVRRKAPYARLNHNDKRIGPNFLNDWFDDIPGLIGRVDSDGKYTSGALVTGGYIIPGDPDHSPFFNLLKFTGPMYKVFNDDEIKLWERWVRSIGPQAPPPPPPADPGAAMSKLIDLMRDRQSGTPGHATNSLAGPDPDHPGQDVTNTVARWFDGTPTPAFMQALANEENGWVVKGNAGASRFVTELLSGDHPMARALGEQRPELGNKTGREVAIAWINAGCPIPGAPRDLAGEVRRLREEAHAAGRRLRRLMLDSPASEILSQPGGRLLGNGTIH
ncbi:MAG: iron-containing redox enzyme family protein, partial [Planctomycetaceae bacterium]